MKFSLLVAGLLIFSLSSYADSIEEIEKDCSRAVVGFLKEHGVISGGEDGLCISDLKSLPQIHVGMGSRTFPLGNADQFQVSKRTQENLQTLREVLTGSNNKATVSFTGYADGEQNNISQFDSRFLAQGETTFTKQDLKNKITDTRTLKTILDLVAKYKDTDKIPYDKTVQSLIRNYYLANDRAKKVCETAMPQGTDCSKAPISGFASPTLELAGNKQCDARRRAFLSFNLSPSGMNKANSNNGSFGPHFETPNPTEYQRDIQIAASADLFSKLAKQTGSSDLDEYAKNIDLILPSECVSNPKVLENTRDNSKRLISHVKENLTKVTDANFKQIVLKGDFSGIKKRLTALNEKEDSGKVLSAEEQAQMKVLLTLTTGIDSEQVKYDKLNNTSTSSLRVEGKVIELRRKSADGTEEVLRIQKATRRMSGSSDGYIVFDEKGQKLFVDPMTIHRIESEWRRTPSKKLYDIQPYESKYSWGYSGSSLGESKYPSASGPNPSTDNFSCFSVAAAIEENMKENDRSLVDASLLVSGEQAKLKVFLDSRSVAHLGNDEARPKGWACDKCQSGVTYGEGGKLTYKPRDPSHPVLAAQAVALQQNSNSLTMGSLKNLKVFNISREAFNGKCSNSKSVCDCVKDIPAGQGELEKLLKHESTQKISMLGQNSIYKGNAKVSRFENTWTLPRPEDSCIFTPPVPHTCQVDPKGVSQESKSQLKDNILACKILDGLKKKYNLAADIDVNKYKKTVLGGAVCKKSLPTSDEEVDCGFKKSSGTSRSSKVTHQ